VTKVAVSAQLLVAARVQILMAADKHLAAEIAI